MLQISYSYYNKGRYQNKSYFIISRQRSHNILLGMLYSGLTHRLNITRGAFFVCAGVTRRHVYETFRLAYVVSFCEQCYEQDHIFRVECADVRRGQCYHLMLLYNTAWSSIYSSILLTHYVYLPIFIKI